jgi:hypothetical protein
MMNSVRVSLLLSLFLLSLEDTTVSGTKAPTTSSSSSSSSKSWSVGAWQFVSDKNREGEIRREEEEEEDEEKEEEEEDEEADIVPRSLDLLNNVRRRHQPGLTSTESWSVGLVVSSFFFFFSRLDVT